MVFSSSLCRAQEAYHRGRAAEALLENVRIVATDAATAWGLEAVAAEQREQRHLRTGLIADAARAGKERSREQDRTFSENPDRSFASS